MPGNKEDWKAWQMVPVAAADRAGLMTLPRCALLGNDAADQSLVYQVDDDPTIAAIAVPYRPDNSVCWIQNPF
jgi:hypothetical protein